MADLAEQKKEYIVYPVKTYAGANAEFIKTGGISFSKTRLINLLKKENNGYHFRIHKNKTYILFGDIDNYIEGIDSYIKVLQDFLEKYYNLKFSTEDFKYTQNSAKSGSYHFSIPKWHLTTEKLKEIFTNFQKYIKELGTGYEKSIDTTIYAEHWFRCPNQSKGTNTNKIDKHVIITGDMEDFIIDYVPKKSISINSTIYIETARIQEPGTNKRKKPIHASINNILPDAFANINLDCIHGTVGMGLQSHASGTGVPRNSRSPGVGLEFNVNGTFGERASGITSNIALTHMSITPLPNGIDTVINTSNAETQVMAVKNLNTDITINKSKIEEYHDEMLLSNVLSKTQTCKKIFDDCYKQERFEKYECWISIGMALKNTFKDDNDAFELFNYYSSKGRNYEGYDITHYKYKSFVRSNCDGYTIATIYYYALEDNKPKFIEIMSKNSLDLGQTDMCKFLKLIAGNKFIYKNNGSSYKLYCYNGKYWVNNDILLRNCLSTELYNFLRNILVEVYWNSKDFSQLKAKIDKLKTITYKREIVETYKEYGVDNSINFDDKWWLLGFNNVVYDMELCEFRDYRYDDYVSITTGYDWREPTTEELHTMNKLIDSIMPIKAERDAYLQILATGLDGRCLEKFVIFNGKGGNGKGMINDIMLIALGNYAMIGNNGILFETSKTGSNPEKANIHKKRFVVFREPPEKNRFENSIIKELTGGGTFSARGLYETNANKELNLTMIIECNKRPLFKEEPGDAEIRRIIDILFRSSFVSDDTLLDPENYIFKANSMYKTRAFQDQHKFALIKILMHEHQKYYKINNSNIILPPSIIERGRQYLEMSCNIVEWFKDTFIANNDSYVTVKDIYELFKISDFYCNLSKHNKAIYTKKYISNYIENNIFFRRYYAERYNNIRSVIKGWSIANPNIALD